MSNSKRVLLDKNVARKLLEGLENLESGIKPSASEQSALELLSPEALAKQHLFIMPSTVNVLARFYSGRSEVRVLKQSTDVLTPSRYWRRWARRLQGLGFTREDARVVSLATFGTDANDSFLGVDVLLTFDKTLINLLRVKQVMIEEMLNALTRELNAPYAKAKLPQVASLGQVK